MAEREEKVWTFENGAVIHPNGTVTGGGPDPKYVNSLNKAVNKYARDFIKALFAGEVPAPSAADCWFCLMGEDQSDHILSHIKEKYYVPSLLVNALMAMPVSDAAIWACQSVWQGHESDVTDWIRDVAKDQLKSALARYIRRQVGLAS